jgi:hypothetical protein
VIEAGFDPAILREHVKCRKVSCQCALGLTHGPYWYLRYEEWDPEHQIIRYRREYVTRRALPRVRAWIRRDRQSSARSRAFLSLARRAIRQETAILTRELEAL